MGSADPAWMKPFQLALFVRFDIDQYIDYEAAASQLLRICEA